MGIPGPRSAYLERCTPYSPTVRCLTVAPIPTHTSSTFLSVEVATGQIRPVVARDLSERYEMERLWALAVPFTVHVVLDGTRGGMIAWRIRAHARTQLLMERDEWALGVLHGLLADTAIGAVVEEDTTVPATCEAVHQAVEAAFSCHAQTPCLPLGHGLVYDTHLRIVTPVMRTCATYVPRGVVWKAPLDGLRRRVVEALTESASASDAGAAACTRRALVVTATPKYWASCHAIVVADSLQRLETAAPDRLVCVHHSLLHRLPNSHVWRLVVLDDAEVYLSTMPYTIRAIHTLVVSDATELLPQPVLDELVCGRSLLTNVERFNVRRQGIITHSSCESDATLEVIPTAQMHGQLPLHIQIEYVPRFFAMRIMAGIQGSENFVHHNTRKFAQGCTECCICFNQGDTMTQCGHVACLPCIRRSATGTCPLCRAPITRAYTTNNAYHQCGDAILKAAAGEDTLVVCGEPSLTRSLRKYFAARHARNVHVLHCSTWMPPRRRPPFLVFAHAVPDPYRPLAYRRACALSPRVAVVVPRDA